MSETSKLKWEGVSSSNIERIAFDPESRTLYVQFKHGGTYAYDDVTAHVFTALLDAPSVGGYFASSVREKYVTRKL